MRILPALAIFAGALCAEDTRAVSGVLRDAVTGAPVADVSVQLVSAGRRAVALKQKSGPGGEVRFEGLDAGTYTVTVTKPGYIDSSYVDGPAWLLHLKAGAVEERFEGEIVPTGAIEGRVFDESGKPLKGVLVYAERPDALSILAISEVEGRYRIENLAPGHSKIEVRVPYSLRQETARRDPDSDELSGYANTQFYPGGFDASVAAPVQVSAGSVLAGFDVHLKRTHLVDLSGHAIDGITREALEDADVALAPEAGGLTDNTYDKRALDSGGRYHFDLIRPGRYTLLFYRDRGAAALPYAVVVEVGRSGLRDNVVTVPAPTTLAGRISVPPDKAAEWGRPTVALLSSSGSRIAQADDGGAFEFDRVPPGLWRLSVMPSKGSSRPWYVSQVRFGPLEIARGAALPVAEGENPPLEIVLSGDSAEIAGIALDSKQQPSRNAVVVARGESGLAATQRISSDGTFALPGLAPGEYSVTAVPGLNASDWRNGTTTSCGAKTVRVSAGAKERRVLQLELCSESPN